VLDGFPRVRERVVATRGAHEVTLALDLRRPRDRRAYEELARAAATLDRAELAHCRGRRSERATFDHPAPLVDRVTVSQRRVEIALSEPALRHWETRPSVRRRAAVVRADSPRALLLATTAHALAVTIAHGEPDALGRLAVTIDASRATTRLRVLSTRWDLVASLGQSASSVNALLTTTLARARVCPRDPWCSARLPASCVYCLAPPGLEGESGLLLDRALLVPTMYEAEASFFAPS
jgi:hypothetical protein